ncbi:hypothetical protein PG995_008456 [Apiospora arundinis]
MRDVNNNGRLPVAASIVSRHWKNQHREVDFREEHKANPSPVHGVDLAATAEKLEAYLKNLL